MILGLSQNHPADQTERQLPSVAAARSLIQSKRPDVIGLLERRRNAFALHFGDQSLPLLQRTEDATLLALARIGVRHGNFGDDYHDYHNENHALEIIDRRMGRVLGQCGVSILSLEDWIALTLFAACHDLRQREETNFQKGVGANEAASIAETFRIMEIAGFSIDRDRAEYVALELMIAGSTFNARPKSTPFVFNPAESAQSDGSLAPRLADELNNSKTNWQVDTDIQNALRLAVIASDLDTANVAERFVELAASAVRLATEREMRIGRALDNNESGLPVFEFLTKDQERYFFELHRFCSELGNRVFAPAKASNTMRLKALTACLHEQFARREPGSYNGAEVIAAQQTYAALV